MSTDTTGDAPVLGCIRADLLRDISGVRLLCDLSEYQMTEKQTTDESLGLLSASDRAYIKRLIRVRCEDCGKNWADYPSKLCPGCEAYREHQR